MQIWKEILKPISCKSKDKRRLGKMSTRRLEHGSLSSTAWPFYRNRGSLVQVRLMSTPVIKKLRSEKRDDIVIHYYEDYTYWGGKLVWITVKIKLRSMKINWTRMSFDMFEWLSEIICDLEWFSVSFTYFLFLKLILNQQN